MEQGPSSIKSPVEELQPGPPLSQRTRGAVAGAVRDSKNLEKRDEFTGQKLDATNVAYQKNKCLSSATSRYPECCFTEGSHSLGSVTLRLYCLKSGWATYSSINDIYRMSATRRFAKKGVLT